MNGHQHHFPGRQQRDDKIVARMEKFAALNEFVRKRNGSIVSLPGAPEALLETLPDSPLPDEMRRLGYVLTEEPGGGERILPSGIIERFSRRTDGGLDLLAPGSTAAVAETRHHAGICKTRRWSFVIP